MTEIPKLQLGSGQINGLNETMDAQKISVSEQMTDGVHAKSDCFIVDLEGFSHGGGLDYDISPDSMITLQRSFSRKGYHRGAVDCNSLLAAADSSSSPTSSSSPRVAIAVESGSISMPEKAAVNSDPPVVHDHSSMNSETSHHHHQHHQIAVKTSNIISTPERRWGRKSNSFKRSPTPWFSHPKSVLLFFATLSSVGTMLLICFTLAISNPYSSSADWEA